MSTLAIAFGAFVLYFVAYHTYGKWLGAKLFKLNPDAKTPAETEADGTDFVVTKKSVVFGHHFTSIAGTGPIVGPAVAVIWGWVPALIWVLVGSIFIGAVHDFGSLVVSLRNKGQTVGDIAGRLISQRTRIVFLAVLFVALTIVLAIFGLVISKVFALYPAAIFPCLVQIPLALGVGVWLHRKGVDLLIPSLAVLALMYLSVIFGNDGLLGSFNGFMAQLSTMTWVILLLGYSYVASVLPVWALLQPRDYINSLQLLSALGLVLVGLVVAGFIGGVPMGEETTRPALEIVAPAVNLSPDGAPPIFPFLFITIACGAISGFHCLVSSGTSSKQLANERDAQFVGYGSMLTEGFLAVLVILACVAGLGLGVATADGTMLSGVAAFESRYSSWGAADGLGEKVGAFVDGSANFLKALGLPTGFAVALMGVFVASFAATTLDTACRLQRYVVQELAATLYRKKDTTAPHPGVTLTANPLTWLSNRHGATIFAVLIAFLIATMPGVPGGAAGTGGLLLWPLFGATNQLLAGLAFLVISFWLRRRGLPTFLTIIPGVVMLALPAVAMALQLRDFADRQSWQGWLLFGIGFATLLLELWMIIEALAIWKRARNLLEPTAAERMEKPENTY